MKNALSYYYHLFPETLIYHNREYSFSIRNIEYRLLPITRSIDEIKEIYQLQNTLFLNGNFSEIIQNQFQEIVTLIQHKYYILVKDKLNHQQFDSMDLLSSSHYFVLGDQYPLLNRSHWVLLWSRKIDYFEYQKKYIRQKYPLLYRTLDYYIGLAENAISYVHNSLLNSGGNEQLVISRRRVSACTNRKDFYCPLNIIIDYRVRDIAEYLKSLFYYDYCYEQEADQLFLQLDYTKVEWELLMGRLLFPSFYFDCYEKIINGVLSEKEIVSVIEKSEDYEYFLKVLYFKIKKYHSLPRIDWLDK